MILQVGLVGRHNKLQIDRPAILSCNEEHLALFPCFSLVFLLNERQQCFLPHCPELHCPFRATAFAGGKFRQKGVNFRERLYMDGGLETLRS